jgi:uncharacterized protein (DUF302 family)
MSLPSRSTTFAWWPTSLLIRLSKPSNSNWGNSTLRYTNHLAMEKMRRKSGQKKKALQYLVGNPLFAVQMTQHDIRASLYAPLRVLLYENEQGATCVEYDKPSSLFGQFGNAKITDVATTLDRKMEQLVAKAIQ